MLQHFSFKGMPCRQVTLNIRGNKELDITRYNKHIINMRSKKESNGLEAYHVSQEIKLEGSHWKGTAEQTPQELYCMIAEVGLYKKCHTKFITGCDSRNNLKASAPKICSLGIHPSELSRSNQCPMISIDICTSHRLYITTEDVR